MNTEQLDKFDRYVRREMSDEELETFRAELEADAEMRKEFNLMRLTKAAMQRDSAQYEAFKKKFIAARPAPLPEPVAVWKKAWVGWLVAASLAGVLLWQNVASLRPALTPPVAQTVDTDDLLLGAGSGNGSMTLPVKNIAVATDSFEVAIKAGMGKKAFLEGQVLTLFFPSDEMPAGKNIRLLMLTLNGKQELYVKIDDRYFPLRQGEQLLVEETNTTILKWLE